MPVFKERPTEIGISLASQLVPEPRLLTHSASFYVDHALEAGYEGHEWYPLRSTTRLGLETNTGQLPEHVKASIKSAHQSWRREKGLWEAWRYEDRAERSGKSGLFVKALALGSWYLFPEANESLDNIVKLQEDLGRLLPVVVYPDTVEGRSRTRLFGNKTYQPDKSAKEGFRLRNGTVRQMLERGRNWGFSSLTVDIHHMLELGPWQEVLPQLLPHTTEIHISLGRIDDDVDPNTEQKLEDLYLGRRGTEIYEILEMIRDQWKGGWVVTEIPYQSLTALRKKHKDSLETKDLMEDHRRIVDNLRAALL